VQRAVAAYEEEYIKMFSAHELLEIAVYYRTESGKARNDELIDGNAVQETPAMQMQARAFYATTAGKKLYNNYTLLQSLALSREKNAFEQSSEFVAFRKSVLSSAKRVGAAK
jgi:hypothetical protein